MPAISRWDLIQRLKG